MKVERQTVWMDENDRELLVQKGPNAFYVPLSSCDRATIEALGKAIAEATATPTERYERSQTH